MVILLKQFLSGQKGQALAIVLCLLAIGGLTITVSVNYASTNLKGSRIIEEKTEEIAIPVGGRGINLPGNRYDMPTLGIKETRVRLESRVYEFKSERLIWSTISESIDPKSTEEIVRQLSGKVVKSLRKNKVLK